MISGRVRLVSQDMHSFLEGMGGHSVPMHPVVVLNWKQGAEVQCWFDAVDDRLASFRSGEEVSVKGAFDFAVPGVVILQHCVLLPEEGGVHVHPFDKEKAAAADAEAARLWQEREKEWGKLREEDPARQASQEGLGIPFFQPSPK